MTGDPQIETVQRDACERAGAGFQPVQWDLKVGVAATVRDPDLWPLNGLRHPPEGDTLGWYFWAGDELDDDPDFFQPLHVHHLGEWRPVLMEYLGLPPGWRLLVAPGLEDLWFDESLLTTD